MQYGVIGSVEEDVVRHRLVRVLLSAAMLIGGAFPASVLAQGLTGQITGTVTDAGGGVMPGATVSIKNAGTNQVRESVTGADGSFTFPDLLAGNYDITVAVQGFKTYEQKGIVLGATDRLALRQITLEVGQLSEHRRRERSSNEHRGAEQDSDEPLSHDFLLH